MDETLEIILLLLFHTGRFFLVTTGDFKQP